MKITRDEFKRSEEKPALELFWQGIRAEETREKYTRTLRRILCVILEDLLEGTFEQRADQLVKLAKQDPEWIMDLLLNLSKKLRERTNLPSDHPDYFNPTSMDNYFKPIRKLLDMNDVILSWKRLHTTFPEIDNITQTREWKLEEIQAMLKFANGAMDKMIVLIAASSGIRSGAFNLNWEDIIPIYKVGDKLKLEIVESEIKNAKVVCAMIIVYRGTSSQYPSFITAEGYDTLQDYRKEWTNQIERESKTNDPIFIQEGSSLKQASIASIKKRVERMVEKAGLRNPLTGGRKRHEVPIMNGFRRFFNKTIKQELSSDSPLASLIKKEYMMGHTGLVKLDRNYFKTNVIELAEEYLAAAPALTISDEYRLKTENKNLREERNDLANKNLIRSLEKRIEELEYGEEARGAEYRKGIMEAKTDFEKIVSLLFPLVIEVNDDEEYKRKYWKELKESSKENRPINRSAFDPTWNEAEERKNRREYAKKLLESMMEQKRHPDNDKPWLKRPKVDMKRLMKELTIQ